MVARLPRFCRERRIGSSCPNAGRFARTCHGYPENRTTEPPSLANYFRPGSPLQASRPAEFNFEFGLCDEIHISGHQTLLYTTGRIRYCSTPDEVHAVFGDAYVTTQSDEIRTERYPQHGIQFSFHADNLVASWVIFRATR